MKKSIPHVSRPRRWHYVRLSLLSLFLPTIVFFVASIKANSLSAPFRVVLSFVSNSKRPSIETGKALRKSEVSTPDEATKTKLLTEYGRLPLSFERNEGQTDQQVKFVSRGPGYDLFLTVDGAVLSLKKPAPFRDKFNPLTSGPLKSEQQKAVVTLKLRGANPNAHVEGRDELQGKINYLVGNDPQLWRTNIPTYQQVHYGEIYPKVDMVYYGNRTELEYDFAVAPGGNPEDIKFHFDGTDRINIDRKGNLRLAVGENEVTVRKPTIYQLTETGDRGEIKGDYVIKGREIGFKVKSFDKRKTLIIDPVISYSTLLGTGSDEYGYGIAVDSQRNAYITGVTQANNFPTTSGAFQTTNNFGAAFVTKLDPSGANLVYSTYLGGNSNATATAIAVDSSGNATVTGYTSASDFPIVNPLKTKSAFFKTTDSASNWNNNNSGLNLDIYSLAVAPNAPNTVYAGTVSGPFRSTNGGVDWQKTPTTGLPSPYTISLAVDPTNALTVYAGMISGGLYKTVNGGTSWNTIALPLSNAVVFAIVFDPTTPSTIYLGSGNGVFKSVDSGASWTALNSFDIPGTPNVRALAIDPITPTTVYAGTLGSGLFKSTNGGSSWSTVSGLNGSFSNHVTGIVIDPSNPSTIYVGHGYSNTGGSIDKTTNGGSSWTAVNTGVPSFAIGSLIIDPVTTSVVYAATTGGGVIKTTNGGANWSQVNTGLWNANIQALVRDPSVSSILYAGSIDSSPATDAFVSKLNVSGSGLMFSTYLGGSDYDEGHGIALDANNIYVTGNTSSTNFPTLNAAQPTFNSVECDDAFVTKINPAGPAYVYSTYLGGNTCDKAWGIAVDSAGNAYVTGGTSSSNFPTANAFQSTLQSSFPGDAFLTKLNANGSLAYSTFLGGSDSDEGFAVALDSSGDAYVTGQTFSTNFPTLNPIQSANAGGFGDVFLTKFNSLGSALVYSTYLGGSNVDSGRGLAVDSSGNAYVTGYSSSGDFPLVNRTIRNKSPFYKSADAGSNWTNDNYGLKGNVGALAINPATPSTILAGTPSGVYKSTDNGRNWVSSSIGLVRPNVVALVFDPVTPSIVYLAASFIDISNSAGVYKSTNGGNSWTPVNNGLGVGGVVCLAIDPLTPTTLYTSPGNRVYKTTNSGDSWTAGGLSNFSINTLVVDPITPTTLYGASAGTSNAGVMKSTDGGATWQSLSFGATTPSISSLAIDPVTPAVYAGGTQGLFKTVNGGANWTLINPGSFLVKAVDSTNPATLYAVAIGSGVYKSTDGGNNWVAINKGFLYPFVSSILISPVNHSTVYAGGGSPTDDDVFVTKINQPGNALVYSTLIGGAPAAGDSSNINDEGFGIAIDATGNAYITGLSRSPGFPVSSDAYQPFNRGFSDVFVTKLTMSYVISGQVVDGSNAPVSNVEVTLSDGSTLRSTFTESDGSYQFSQLIEGGNFTVAAAKPHFTVAPPSQTFNNLSSNQTANFVATATNAPFYAISGQVKENATPLAGVVVTLSGSQSGTRTTDSAGNYSFTLLEAGNYTVTPAKLGFTFAPASQTFNNLSANQTVDFSATRQSFVVTNANDHGTGSLRQAMLDANATAGLDTITFNIPGSGVHTVNLLQALPVVTDPVVIDATTQPGFAGSPLIELNGAQTGSNADGLRITAGSSTIRGFVINRFTSSAGIVLSGNGGNIIQGNYLGTDATGLLARANVGGVLITNASANNIIGGTTAAARNVISGNISYGVFVGGSGNQIQGNFIGTNATGNVALGNGQTGVEISGSPTFTNNLIGGPTAGAGNVISGNSNRGIYILAPGNAVQGNLIGTDVTGLQKVGNGTGVYCEGANNLVGGTAAGTRNVISGNTQGIYILGAGSKLQGNFIGTDITGTVALGNTIGGVFAGNHALIGGTVSEARNTISGNAGTGNVSLGYNIGQGDSVTVQGNFIGTDVTGNVALPNSTYGILVSSSSNVIGGPTSSAANVISGNTLGIEMGGVTTATLTGNIVQGNLIGVNANGDMPLPNLSGGIALEGTVNNSVIGGATNDTANTIAFNGGSGVAVSFGAGNVIQSNSIFSNYGLGIDLSPVGVTANDILDLDSGANNLQNWPQLTSVGASGGGTLIQGTLNSKANTTFRIDFYSNSACDSSGNGEGGRFFDTTSVTTDASGNALINFTSSVAMPAGRVLTATATDPTGNTSEFSPCDSTNAAGSLAFENYSYNVLEDVGSAVLNVVRTGGSKGTLSVNYVSANGTATAGADYTAISGTLVFADGEKMKSITLPIANDGITEADETLRLSLSGTSNIEALGSPAIATVTIQDPNTALFILPNDMDVPEGDSGSTNRTVTFNLSAQTSRTVTVNYNSQGVSATSGVDFGPVSGTLTFAPTVTTRTVSVPIFGDTLDESNETFAIVLSNPVNAGLVGGFATVGILDDDPLPVLSISDAAITEGDSGTTSAQFNLTLSPASGRTVSLFFSTANGTATAGTDYVSTSNGVVFNPGQTSKTINVTVNGDTSPEADETFFVNLSGVSTATLQRTQAIGTILDDDTIHLILETSGPNSNQGAALESLLIVRDPFRVTSIADWLNLGADRNTRVTVLATNLRLGAGETAASVVVRLVDVNGQIRDVSAEDVRLVPNSIFTQVTFRLPDSLPAGTCMVSIKAHNQTSNAGVIRIAP